MIVELRGAGAQTLVGPSIHPDSGEPYDMLDGEPAAVSGHVLATWVKALADAVIEARHGKPATDVNKSKPPPTPKGRPARALAADAAAVYHRAVAYVEAMPPAISGSGGHSATYAAATAVVHGFALDPEVTYNLLLEYYNPRCKPMWSENELQHKIDDAATKEHDNARGWLRDRPMIGKPSRVPPASGRNDAADRYEPFPVDALPAPIRGFVENVANTVGCDPSYVALPLLSALAAAIGNTYRIQLKKGWTEPAIVWSAIVGDSGSGKSPALEAVFQSINKLQAELLRAHAEAMQNFDLTELTYQCEINAWKREKERGDPPSKPKEPAATRILCSDTTIEAIVVLHRDNWRGLCLVRDELSGWIGGFDRYSQVKRGDVAHWLEMFGGRPMLVDRKTGPDRTIFIPRASVSIAGGIQTEVLRRVLGRENFENGLAARLLLAMPPRRERAWTERELDEDLQAKIQKVFNHLYAIKPATDPNDDPIPRILRLTDAAKAAFVRFYGDHAREQVGTSGDLAAAFSKLEAYAARFALVIHCVRHAADDPSLDLDIVDVSSISAGVTLTQWFKRETRRIYARLGESEEERGHRGLVELIRQRGDSVSVRDWQRARSHKTSDDAAAELEALVKGGYGTWETPRQKGPGRPTQRFVLASDTDKNPQEGTTGGFVSVRGVRTPEPDNPAGPHDAVGGARA